jgi:hypothetical protein
MYVHGVWGIDFEKKAVVLIPIPKGTPRTAPLNELNDFIASIREITFGVQELAVDLSLRPHYIVNISYNIGK